MKKKTKSKLIQQIVLYASLGIASFHYSTYVHAKERTDTAYQLSPFPNELKHYKTQVFNLFDKSAVDQNTKRPLYDATFVQQFEAALKPYLKLDRMLEKKLLSGPASEGKYIEINGKPYLFYTICQAHACNTTNIAVLYQHDTKKIVGRLQYKCDIHLLNDPTSSEINTVNNLSPIDQTDEFYKTACAEEKHERK